MYNLSPQLRPPRKCLQDCVNLCVCVAQRPHGGELRHTVARPEAAGIYMRQIRGRSPAREVSMARQPLYNNAGFVYCPLEDTPCYCDPDPGLCYVLVQVGREGGNGLQRSSGA